MKKKYKRRSRSVSKSRYRNRSFSRSVSKGKSRSRSKSHQRSPSQSSRDIQPLKLKPVPAKPDDFQELISKSKAKQSSDNQISENLSVITVSQKSDCLKGNNYRIIFLTLGILLEGILKQFKLLLFLKIEAVNLSKFWFHKSCSLSQIFS